MDLIFSHGQADAEKISDDTRRHMQRKEPRGLFQFTKCEFVFGISSSSLHWIFSGDRAKGGPTGG